MFLVREVSSFQDYYKTNYIITCHQIRLHCSVLLYSVWIYFCSFQFCFHSKIIVSPTRRPFVRPPICREIPKYSPEKLLALRYQTFINLRKKPRGVTAGVGRNISYPLLTAVKLTSSCAILFLTVLWLLLYLCFRINVMGLLFVLVNMSVIINVYAFLGQRSTAVSF